MIRPIIIFGLNRNGTTWLGNTLHNKYNVALAYHELNFGSCEINLYRINMKYGNFENKDGYHHFLNEYKNCDVFTSLEGNYNRLREMKFNNFYSFFIELIHQYTLKNGKNFWALKLEAQILSNKSELEEFQQLLNKRYGTVSYLSIQRNFDVYMNSIIGLYKLNQNYSKVVDLIYTAEYHYHYSKINKFIKSVYGISLWFDKTSTTQLEKQLEAQYNFKLETPTSGYEIVNTSNLDNSTRFSFLQKLIFKLLQSLPPLNSFLVYILEKYRLRKNKKNKLWKERIKTARENPEKLIKEFTDRYESKLIPFIKKTYVKK